MRRWLLILFLCGAVGACGASGWWAAARLDAPFVALGAADVRVSQRGLGERVITYTIPDPNGAWLTPVANRLRASGWSLSLEDYRWGTTENYLPVYVRSVQFWCVQHEERAELLGDRHAAHIRVISSVTVACL